MASGGLGLSAFEHDFGYEGFLHHAVPGLKVKNFLFSPPTRFGARYLQELQDAEHVDCFLDATLVRLVTAGSDVDKSLIASSNGTQTQVSANYHVLAMGGVENARMLLHSGIANSSGFLGRCFSDHLGFTVGIALLNPGNRYFLHHVHHGSRRLRVLPHLSLSDETMREHRLANFGILIDQRGSRVLETQGHEVRYQLDRLTSGKSLAFRVLVRMENTPNPHSRITLTNDRDAYGVPRTALNWQINDFDLEYVDRLCALLGRQLGMAGGRLRVDYTLARARRRPGSYQAHHMGTTRMSADPDKGVVDANLRSHDVSNLYVAGSSVFSAFGFANPTLTIVALSIRLAQHLRRRTGLAGA